MHAERVQSVSEGFTYGKTWPSLLERLLRLSLVSIPVEIYNAVDSSTDIQFNQIHKPSGKRINYTKTVKGVGPIEAADIVKGYEIDKDEYVIVNPRKSRR